MFCILWNSLANIWVVLLVPYYLLEWFTSATFKNSAEKTEMWTSSPNQFCAAGNFDNCKNWFSMVRQTRHFGFTAIWSQTPRLSEREVRTCTATNCCDRFKDLVVQRGHYQKTLFSHHLKILIHFLCPNNISEVPVGDSVKKRATPPFRYIVG